MHILGSRYSGRNLMVTRLGSEEHKEDVEQREFARVFLRYMWSMVLWHREEWGCYQDWEPKGTRSESTQWLLRAQWNVSWL